jgi:hypothetical protein
LALIEIVLGYPVDNLLLFVDDVTVVEVSLNTELDLTLSEGYHNITVCRVNIVRMIVPF